MEEVKQSTTLGQRVKVAVVLSGMTSGKVADLLGISRANLSSLCKQDKVNASIIQIMKIALICDVSDVWLLTGKGQPRLDQKSVEV